MGMFIILMVGGLSLFGLFGWVIYMSCSNRY